MLELAKRNWNLPKPQSMILEQRIFVLLIQFIELPRPVYELEDLNKTLIDGQFNGEEWKPVGISKRTMYHIVKLLKQRHRKGILEYLVRWRGYPSSFDSWVPASSVKNITRTWTTIRNILRDTVEYRFTTYIYTDNTHYDFIVEIAQTIDLCNNDKWD